MDFKCYSCNKIFQAKGKKKDFTDPIYGQCSKWVATCPDCKQEASDYKPVLGKSKSKPAMPQCGMEGACSSCSFNH